MQECMAPHDQEIFLLKDAEIRSFEVKCRLFVWNKKVVDQFFPILASKPNFPKIFFLNDLMLRCASSRPSYGNFLLKVSTNVPTFHKWGARWRSLPTKECVKVSKKLKRPFWRISLALEPLGFQTLHKVISHNSGDNNHLELLSTHAIFNINGEE